MSGGPSGWMVACGEITGRVGVRKKNYTNEDVFFIVLLFQLYWYFSSCIISISPTPNRRMDTELKKLSPNISCMYSTSASSLDINRQ